MLTAIAAAVFFASKFTEGAWLLLIIIPALILLFARIERYYRYVAKALGIGEIPPRPGAGAQHDGVVVVPIVAVNRLAERAMAAAGRLGAEVVPVTVELDQDRTQALRDAWRRWDPGPELQVLPSPHRDLVNPVVDFVQERLALGQQVTVLLAEVEPRRRRYQLLHNQRGLILAASLRQRTDAIVATLPFRL